MTAADSPHPHGTSASAPPEGQSPGHEAYRCAAEHYFALATTMHRVLMAIHTGEWTVDHGAYGAFCSTCLYPDGEAGYSMNYARSVHLTDPPEQIQARAVAALGTDGLTVTTSAFGTGEVDQYNVIAAGEDIERAAVRISTATGRVRVTAQTPALPGRALEVNHGIFGDDADDVWRRLPATEGPDSVPQFHFPPGGPLYYEPDGTPVEPQPTPH